MNKVKKQINWLLFIAFLLFSMFIATYSYVANTLAISYWDEMLWVGRSYFFDFYIKGDFNNPVWQSHESKDQPKLVEYVYGAWLYPKYLLVKAEKNESKYEYGYFLIDHHMHAFSEDSSPEYESYYKSKESTFIKVAETETGSPSEYVKKYGPDVEKLTSLIHYARFINVLLLSITSVIVFYLLSLRNEYLTALLTTLFFGFNTLIMAAALKAHSEALFILLSTLSITSAFLYVLRGQRLQHLILFSLTAGLCAATKLNGALLLLQFLSIITTLAFFKKLPVKKTLTTFAFHSIVSSTVFLLTFILLNPFTFSNPVTGIKEIFRYRIENSLGQAQAFNEFYLSEPLVRFSKLYSHFFTPEGAYTYNAVLGTNNLGNTSYPFAMLLFFLVGFIISARKAFKGEIFHLLMLFFFLSTLIALCIYVILDWPRYYIQIVLFISIFEIYGVLYVLKTFLKALNAQSRFSFK